MKIEIDFSKPDELRKMKREFELAIATIETALSAAERNVPDPNQPPLPKIIDSANEKSKVDMVGILQSNSPIARIISELPAEFLMTDIFAAAETAGFPPSRIRNYVAELVEGGWITLIQAGSGRRASRFRKA